MKGNHKRSKHDLAKCEALPDAQLKLIKTFRQIQELPFQTIMQ